MRTPGNTDFYEDDEDPRAVIAAFDAGEKVVSAKPGTLNRALGDTDAGFSVRAWAVTGARDSRVVTPGIRL